MLVNINVNSGFFTMNRPVPFKAELKRLHQQLLLTQFSTQVATENRWAQGPPVEEIKNLVSYWRGVLDWRS